MKLETRIKRIVKKYENDDATCERHKSHVIRTLNALQHALQSAVVTAETDWKSLLATGRGTFPHGRTMGETAAERILRASLDFLNCQSAHR